MKQETFKEFKEKVLHEWDDLFAILFVNFITLRLAYLIKKHNIKITPNQVTYSRMFLIAPLIVLFLFLAPLTGKGMFYLLALVVSYLFIASDWLDGQIARGMNQTSKKGEFLDSIADRTSIIIFFTLIISIGMCVQNNFLIYGGISLFILKTFNLMVISKIFYSGMIPKKQMDASERYKDKNMLKLFGGEDSKKMGISIIEAILEELNKHLKIKRWNPKIIVPERYFLTIMVPCLLIFIGLDKCAIYLLGFCVIIFNVFFIMRNINLFRSYV